MTISSTIAPSNAQSSYLQVEFDLPQDEKRQSEIIAERHRRIASVVNIKENAQYEKRELLSAEQWFSANPTGETPGYIITKYGFRTTIDCVALNGGVSIPIGVTVLVLTSGATATMPPAISGYTVPLPSHIAGLGADGVSIWEPLVYATFTSSTNTLTITNNYSAALTWCVFVLEYLKQ